MTILRAFPVFLCFVFPFGSYGQQKQLIHQPRTSGIIAGLRREFIAELAPISIEVNPGWRAEEIDDAKEHIYQLLFTDPADSANKILSLLLEHFESKGFDSAKWDGLKKSIRESYGNRGIALRPLEEKITSASVRTNSGILAYYELLAKHDDFIEYIDAIVGKTFLVLLSVPLRPEEYQQKIAYYRDIAGSIRLGMIK